MTPTIKWTYCEKEDVAGVLNGEEGWADVVCSTFCPMDTDKERLKQIVVEHNCHDALVEALENIEWSGSDEGDFCPHCDHCKSQGHADYCMTGQALKLVKETI